MILATCCQLSLDRDLRIYNEAIWQKMQQHASSINYLNKKKRLVYDKWSIVVVNNKRKHLDLQKENF